MNIKNIEAVLPITENRPLAQINCHHEKLRTNVSWHETFFMDEDGNIVANFENEKPFLVQQLTSKHKDLFIIKLKNIYHIIQVYQNLSYMILNSYEVIELGVEDGCFAVKQNGLWGFINEEAEEIIEPQYENYCAFSNGFAAVCKNNKWGFIDKQNEIVIPFEYEIPDYSCFNGNYAPVCKNDKFGFIDMSNRAVIPFKYENALIRSKYGKLFPVKLNGKWGFIDYNENVVIPFNFDDVECNADRYSVYQVMKKVDEKDLYGLVDARSNKVIIPCEYLSLCPNPNSIQAQKQEGKYVLLNWNGEEVSEEYEFIDEYSHDDLYVARNNKKEGFINENGEIVIPIEYNKCEPFYGGFAIVKHKDCFWIINRLNLSVFDDNKCNKIYNTGLGIFIKSENNNSYCIDNLSLSYIEQVSADELKPETYKFIKNIDARSLFLQKIGIEKMLQYGTVVDTYENYPDNEMWAKSEYKIIDMHLILPPQRIIKPWRQIKSDKRKYTYAPYLYMKNQTTGVYHLEGIHPRCRTLYDAIKMRYNGLNIKDFEIKDIK